MGAVGESEVSEAQIAVHWREEAYYEPPPSFVAQANAHVAAAAVPRDAYSCRAISTTP